MRIPIMLILQRVINGAKADNLIVVIYGGLVER